MPLGIRVIWDKKELEELYWTKELNYQDIAYLKHLSASSVRKAFIRLNIRRRTVSETHKLMIRQTGKYNKPPVLLMEKNPHWKGGRSELKSGYVLVLCHDHPRATKSNHFYVFEHILVWEKAHNCYLPVDQQVHHLNGVRNDNRPENLVAVSKFKHEPFTLMRILQERIRALEKQVKIPISEQCEIPNYISCTSEVWQRNNPGGSTHA
jgi:hypothetical protein